MVVLAVSVVQLSMFLPAKRLGVTVSVLRELAVTSEPLRRRRGSEWSSCKAVEETRGDDRADSNVSKNDEDGVKYLEIPDVVEDMVLE